MIFNDYEHCALERNCRNVSYAKDLPSSDLSDTNNFSFTAAPVTSSLKVIKLTNSLFKNMKTS